MTNLIGNAQNIRLKVVYLITYITTYIAYEYLGSS